MTAASEPAPSMDSMRVDVLRGSPRSDELAALLAVVTEAYAEESAGATADDTTARTGWTLRSGLCASRCDAISAGAASAAEAYTGIPMRPHACPPKYLQTPLWTPTHTYLAGTHFAFG